VLIGLSLVLVAGGALAFRGRWVAIYDYRSGGMASTLGPGTGSSGGEGQVILSGKPAHFVWRLNRAVVRVHVAITRLGGVSWPDLDSWPDLRSYELRPSGVIATEFATTDRAGFWDLGDLPPGRYWITYHWSTSGRETGEWSFRVEEMLPWWQKGRS
jgi:hypothetical protein